MNEQETGPRVLTCVYCGLEYPQNTPAWGSEVLTQHIKVCEKHPMRQLELKLQITRDSLARFVDILNYQSKQPIPNILVLREVASDLNNIWHML